ncbi:MAG: hypothetical protein OXC19_03820 [Bryobacterales bacterium]|nr:hypothetical protein [Bryobacterales bacterium]
MRDSPSEFRFTIDAFTPDTLPMSRLAEYMADLARLLGEVERVHFLRLEDGSTALVHVIESEAVSVVRNRVQSVTSDDAPKDVAKAFTGLNRLLTEDNAIGSLRENESDVVVEFPGRDQEELVTYGVVSQPGILDGQLIRIGGKDETVPVHLQDGDAIHICNTNREIARHLGRYLYGTTLRVHGIGRWVRDPDEGWLLRRFNINEFQVLSDTLLSEVVGQLRGVEGSDWKNVDDPSAELDRLRRSEKIH